MSPRTPEQRSLMAAEYVIGTLRGPARRRFERLLQSEPSLADEVRRWEGHLHRLMTQHLPPQDVPPELWQRILDRIDAEAAGRAAPAPARGQRGVRRRRRTWAAIAAVLLLGMVALLLPERVEHPEPPLVAEQAEAIATLALEDSGLRWQIERVDGRLRARLLPVADADPVIAEDIDYELWWVAEGAPLSLGVLPRSGVREQPLPEAVGALDAGALAISREARGGSQDGTPAEVLAVFPLSES